MSSVSDDGINLVADIGGTNIRLAIASENNCLTKIQTYRCAKFSGLLAVINQYMTENKIKGQKTNACLAIACPVDHDLISMTNLPWNFSQQELKQQLELNSLCLINDYTAIAMAIPFLNDTQKIKIGGGSYTSDKVISICGPGTGLGVATLTPIANKWYCLSGEGGHVDFAPVDEIEIQILQYLLESKRRVSYEQLLSGYGLEQIFQALAHLQKSQNGQVINYDKLSAEQITARAIVNSCNICYQALSIFCGVLGSFAGNLALTANSLGGVYIAGGIAPRFIEFIEQSNFRERFEDKGRLSSLTKQTPTYVIIESQPGLLGASAYLNQC
jgi:glucokinase